jgi:hypothetical protein
MTTIHRVGAGPVLGQRAAAKNLLQIQTLRTPRVCRLLAHRRIFPDTALTQTQGSGPSLANPLLHLAGNKHVVGGAGDTGVLARAAI